MSFHDTQPASHFHPNSPLETHTIYINTGNVIWSLDLSYMMQSYNNVVLIYRRPHLQINTVLENGLARGGGQKTASGNETTEDKTEWKREESGAYVPTNSFEFENTRPLIRKSYSMNVPLTIIHCHILWKDSYTRMLCIHIRGSSIEYEAPSQNKKNLRKILDSFK